jgi:hypothetical protein
MYIEHSDCLSLFWQSCKSHEQDGETLSLPPMPHRDTAPSDPAMAFGLPLVDGRRFARFLNRQRLFAAGRMAGTCETLQKRANVPRANTQRRIPSRSINDL